MMTAPFGPEQSGSRFMPHADHPHLITYRRDMFADGSVGTEHFPDLLEGYTRPDMAAKHVPYSIVVEGERLTTYGQFCELPKTALVGLSNRSSERVHQAIVNNFDRMRGILQHTPAGNLLLTSAGVRPSNYLPITPTDEPELEEHLRSYLKKKFDNNPSAFGAVVMRFGLDSWQLQELDDVAAASGLTRTEVRKAEQHILFGLRTDPDGIALHKGFGTLPINSLGARIGAHYTSDIPHTDGAFEQSGGFTDDEKHMLASLQPSSLVVTDRQHDSVLRVASADLDRRGYQIDNLPQLAQKLGKFVRLHDNTEAVNTFGRELRAMTEPFNAEHVGLVPLLVVNGRNQSVDQLVRTAEAVRPTVDAIERM
jgi:hypothetical protein